MDKRSGNSIQIWVFYGLLLTTLLYISPTGVEGQVNKLETDKGIAASIAPYNADVREAILLVSEYPQILTQLQNDQSETVETFHNLINGFDHSKQNWFYTITRYPDVLHSLATTPLKQDKEVIYKLLPNQDADLKEAAWKLYNNEYNNLVKLDNINISLKLKFNQTIQPLDKSVKSAFEKLSAMPDVLTLLTNNIELTTRLGQHYHSDPVDLNNRLAGIHDSLNIQNQYENAAYKKQMAEDPKTTEELNQAAKDYAKENGYDVPAQQNYDTDNTDYYANPYSYWFGYPDWYSYPLWYPGSFWYDSGIYYGAAGFGIWGLPGYGFSKWFFNKGHYNRYPSLYRQFGNYYHSNIAENRYMGSVNHGFMGIANSHFNPNGTNRLNQLTSPASFQRAGGQSVQKNVRSSTHSNANTYHSQAWHSFGGRDNAVHNIGGRSAGSSFGHGGGGGGHGGGGGKR